MDVWNREDFTQFGTDGLNRKFKSNVAKIKKIESIQRDKSVIT